MLQYAQSTRKQTVAVDTVESDELQALLTRCLPAAYGFYRGVIQESALRGLAQRRARRVLDSADSSTILAHHGRHVAGLACWRKLPWDTEQFGIPAGRVEFLLSDGDYAESHARKSALLRQVIASSQSHGVRHLTARVGAGDLSSIHALEGAGFELIDGIQTFSMQLDHADPAPETDGIDVRLLRPEELDQVVAIARAAYVFDRFHADSALSNDTADAVNEAWVRNCCLGKAADAVVVACEGQTVLAYVTCNVDIDAAAELGIFIGTIGMVATAASARRRGVARSATWGALQWFRDHGVDIVEVGTQLRNVPAGRLYEQCGFRLTTVNLTFRKIT